MVLQASFLKNFKHPSNPEAWWVNNMHLKKKWWRWLKYVFHKNQVWWAIRLNFKKWRVEDKNVSKRQKCKKKMNNYKCKKWISMECWWMSVRCSLTLLLKKELKRRRKKIKNKKSSCHLHHQQWPYPPP